LVPAYTACREEGAVKRLLLEIFSDDIRNIYMLLLLLKQGKPTWICGWRSSGWLATASKVWKRN